MSSPVPHTHPVLIGLALALEDELNDKALGTLYEAEVVIQEQALLIRRLTQMLVATSQENAQLKALLLRKKEAVGGEKDVAC